MRSGLADIAVHQSSDFFYRQVQPADIDPGLTLGSVDDEGVTTFIGIDLPVRYRVPLNKAVIFQRDPESICRKYQHGFAAGGLFVHPQADNGQYYHRYEAGQVYHGIRLRPNRDKEGKGHRDQEKAK